MVGAPERLVFEGGPLLDPPVRQEPERAASQTAISGTALNTIADCLPLTVADKSRLQELKAKSAHRLAGERAKAHQAFIAAQAKQLAARKGINSQGGNAHDRAAMRGRLAAGRRAAVRRSELAGCTVADILADPDKFEGATLADPLEGVE